jgi:ribose 5-phosphate isomerase RpiB
MIVTARQLEDLHRSNGANGHVVLPYRARLTPLAQDWLKHKRVAVGYSGDGTVTVASAAVPASTPSSDTTPAPVSGRAQHAGFAAAAPSKTSGEPFVWWCDGPCGPTKAAIVSQEKESNLRPMQLAPGATQVIAAIKQLASDVKSGTVAGGILIVQHGAAAMVFANRCPSLRAVLGTCFEAVEQGVQQVGANVLVIEHAYKTLPQVKNLLSRFLRGNRELSEDVRRQLAELASCG